MVFVTGGSGLLGQALIHQLIQQHKRVRALVHSTPIQIDGVESVQGSILDVIGLEDSLQGVNEVYHCAGWVSYTPGAAKQLYKINVEGTANVVNVALEAGVRKLVHVGSVAALEATEAGSIINEESKWKNGSGKSAYAKSKYFGEMEVWRAMAEGLHAVVVNPSVILGNGNWHTGSTAMFKSAYNGFPWYTNGVTGYVDVEDVAKAMILLMNSHIHEERFVLSGHNATYREVFTLMAQAFQSAPPKWKVSPTLAALVWRFEKLKSLFSGKEPLLTKETATMSFAEQYYSGLSITERFPEFSYTPLETTIARVCKALQQKLNIH